MPAARSRACAAPGRRARRRPARPGRRCAGRRTTIAPCDAAHRPMIVRSVVVLPAPLRPSSIVTAPAGTSRSTPCRMWYAPMCVCTPASDSSGGGARSRARLSASGAMPRYACCTIGEAITAVGSPSATSWPLCSTTMRSASSRTTSILCSTSRMVFVGSRLEAPDQVEDHRHVGDAHAGGRLVEHVDARLERHQHRHLELALVAVRQAARRRVGAIGEVHALDQRAGARQRLLAVEPDREQGRAPRAGATAPRGARSRARERPGNSCVSWKARPRPRCVRAGALSRVMSAPSSQTEPALALQLAGDQVEVRRLAGAVRADDRRQRAGLEARTRRGRRRRGRRTGSSSSRVSSTAAAHAPERQRACRRQRLLRIGTFISSGLISRTSSGTPQANAGSALMRKWYMHCIA